MNSVAAHAVEYARELRCGIGRVMQQAGVTSQTSYLLKKMKKELPILRGHPERGEEISHADPEMFIMMIDRGRMVWLDL